MKKTFLFKTLVCSLIFIGFFSCSKEEISPVTKEDNLSELLKQYPSEITTENWEEFVYAPQAVIDHFQKLEFEKDQQANPENVRPTNSDRNVIKGLVQAYKFGWKSIPGVLIIAGTCQNILTTNSNSNYNYELTCNAGISCMEYSTPASNGLTGFDLTITQRHILGLQYFTDARQYLAADVNRSGTITSFDIILMNKVILGQSSSFPNSDNVVFVTNDDFADVQSTIGGSGSINSSLLQAVGKTNNCLGVSYRNRRAIKTGDVSGNFNF